MIAKQRKVKTFILRSIEAYTRWFKKFKEYNNIYAGLLSGEGAWIKVTITCSDKEI